jgi:hypothetical protein
VFRAGSNVAALAEHENGSLGAVEIDDLDRLSADDVLELVALSSAKLREGGHLVVEYRGRPRLIHPGYLGSVLSQAGFSSVVVEWMPDGADFAVIATR